MQCLRVVVIAGLVAGCGSEVSTEPLSIAGHYSLESVRDKPLPVVLEEGADHSLEIIAGEITITREETFHDSYTIRETNAGVATVTTKTCDGTWHVSSQYIALEESPAPGCGDSALGDWDHATGNKITISWTGLWPAVYSR
jgi:hypothetical protein